MILSKEFLFSILFGEKKIDLIIVSSELQVSHTYSREVSGNPAIAPHLQKFHGILNGIDPDMWDPYNDKFITVSFCF